MRIFGFFVDLVAAVRIGRRIATTSAVVLSQVRGNGVYEKFSADTFPAAPAQEPAVTSTCCASLKACRAPSAGRSHIRPPRSTAAAACCASAVSQDRAAGVVNAGSRGAPANVTPPDAVQKRFIADLVAPRDRHRPQTRLSFRERRRATLSYRYRLRAPTEESSCVYFVASLQPRKGGHRRIRASATGLAVRTVDSSVGARMPCKTPGSTRRLPRIDRSALRL